MKQLVSLVAAIIIILSLALEHANLTAQSKLKQHEHQHTTTSTLPSSLDNFYPPKTEQPVYLFRMMGLAMPFSGCFADLSENDIPNAMTNFEKFKAEYAAVSKLVPEWEDDFPTAPVEELETALKSGDQGKVMAAAQKVGKVCHNCHLTKMPLVQFKYHWQDFHTIEVEDPLTKQPVSFVQLKQFMEGNFTGMMVDLQQNQKENAKKQFQGFNARFQTLKETCANCHDTERFYYIDESVQAMIDKLGKAIDSPTTDPKVVQQLGQGIGMESCTKCHKVHVPAALAKYQWRK